MPITRLCHKKQIVINPILCIQDSRKQASKQASKNQSERKNWDKCKLHVFSL